jgi:hypothetical protein
MHIVDVSRRGWPARFIRSSRQGHALTQIKLSRPFPNHLLRNLNFLVGLSVFPLVVAFAMRVLS